MLRRYLQKGLFNGQPYENIAIFNVGSGPSPAPTDKRFDPGFIPRIRASETKTDGFGLYDWLEYFDKNPEKRFVSDGDVNTITIPRSQANHLARERLGGRSIIIVDD
jgi:hypothetical protein